MSGLDNKISNIIGTKIPFWVLNQLNVRSEKGYAGYRDNENLQFLGNKTSWVRLISSIDLGQDDINFFNTNLPVSIQNPQDLARNYILFAGTSKFLNTNEYNLRSGIGKDGAYGILGTEEIQKFGYRPMPGIVDVTIETQGRLGSVRSATVNFRCWDKDQLDIMDALYFKLGYSMFLEWAQTYFYPTELNPLKFEVGKLQSTDIFSIDPFAKDMTKEEIQEQIAKNNRGSEGNYDAMLGIVTNFTFSSNAEGGYDCTLKLISLGILGDRLKINNSGILPEILEEEIKRYNKTVEETTKAANIIEGRQGGGTTTGTTTTTTTIQILSTKEMIDRYGKFNSTTQLYDGSFSQLYPSSKKELPQNADLVLGIDPNNQTPSGKKAFIIRRLNGFIPLEDAIINETSIYLSKKDILDDVLNSFSKNDDTWDISNVKAWKIPGNISRAFTFAENESENFTKIFTSGTNNKKYKIQILKNSYGTAIDNKQINGYIGPAIDSLVKVEPDIFGKELLKLLTSEEIPYKLTGIEMSMRPGEYSITGPNANNAKYWPYEFTVQANLLVTTQADVYKIETDQFNNTKQTPAGLGPVQSSVRFQITFSDTDFIKYFKTPEGVKQGSGFLSKPDPNAPVPQTPPPPPPAEQQTTSPEQIKSALASQSSLELILRAIQMHALNKAIEKGGLNIGDRIFRLEMWQPDKDSRQFLSQIFSNGIFTKILTDLIDNDIKQSTAFKNYINNEAPTIDDRLKVQAAYGFASAMMKNKVTEADVNLLSPVFFKDVLNAYVIPYEVSQELIAGTKTNHPVHIPLGLLLMILNHTCTIYDSKTIASTQTPLVYIDFNPNHNFCLSSKKQITTNPFKVLIPCEAELSDYIELFDEVVLSSDKKSIKPLAGNKEATPLFKSSNTRDVADLISAQLPPYRYVINTKGSETAAYRGQLMNILVSIDYVANLVKDFSTKDATNNVYLKPFLDQIIDDINKYLGNINILRVAYLDTSNTFQIVDDQIVPPREGEEMLSSKAPKNTTMLPLYGLQSIAKTLEIKTDISSRLSNTLAISANATIDGKSTLSNSADSFGFINSNYVDRFITNRLEPTGSGIRKDTDSMITAASQFNSTINDFYGSATPNESNVGQATGYYIEKMQKLKNKDFATRASAMIPVSLQFSTDGIGGLSMGQAFTVPDQLLPYTYDTRKINVKGLGVDVISKVGFVITGLTHNISNNSWNSTIKANMVYLKDLTDFSSSISQLKDVGESLRRSQAATSTGPCEDPYTTNNLNKGWEGKKQAFKRTVIDPAVEGPKLSAKYGKTLAKSIMAVIQIEQNFKGFNYNFGGYDITSGGWSFNPALHDGYVVAKEGGTGLCKAFISFKSYEAFIEQKVGNFKDKGFESADTAEKFAKLWLEKWNGYGVRTKYPNRPIAEIDAEALRDAANIWNGITKYV